MLNEASCLSVGLLPRLRDVKSAPPPCRAVPEVQPRPVLVSAPPGSADAPCVGVGARSCGWQRLHPRLGRSAGDRLFPGWSLPGRRAWRACVCRAPTVCVWAVPPHPQMTYLDHFLKFGSQQSCRLPVVLGHLPGDAVLNRVSVGLPGPRVAANLGLPLLTYLGWPARTPSSVPLGVLVRMRVSHEVLSCCCLLDGDRRVTESASSAPGVGSVTSAFLVSARILETSPRNGLQALGAPVSQDPGQFLGRSAPRRHPQAVPESRQGGAPAPGGGRKVLGKLLPGDAGSFLQTALHTAGASSACPPNTAPQPCSFWPIQCSNL